MSNPITLFDDLREMYLRYLDSPFDLRYPDLVAERQHFHGSREHRPRRRHRAPPFFVCAPTAAPVGAGVSRRRRRRRARRSAARTSRRRRRA